MISDRLARHLRFLVEEAGPRPPGSPANHKATEHARDVLTSAGFTVHESPFTTRWWEPGTGRLELHDDMDAVETLEVAPNPYSPPCDVLGRLHHVFELGEITAESVGPGAILVIGGDLVREQLVPVGYPFYGVDEHGALVRALIEVAPAAVIAVSDHWAPIFEDATLPFASTTVPTAFCSWLAEREQARLVLGGAVHEAAGVNLSARLGAPGDRIVLSAHLDSKVTTPGAFDNAASAAVLLTAAETGLLTEPSSIPPVEVVLFNGEDHYDACGEMAWLADTDLSEIKANVNLDGAGVAGRTTQVSTFVCPPSAERAVTSFVAGHHGWVVGPPWPQSDHSIFAMRGIPALAITSHGVDDLIKTLAHTERDTLDVLDLAVLTDLTEALPGLLTTLWRGLHEGQVTGSAA